MILTIQQSTGALHVERVASGRVRLTVDHYRGRERIELDQKELQVLSAEIDYLIREKSQAANG